MSIEKRYIPVEESELRFDSVEDNNGIKGYSLKWSSLSKMMRHEKYGNFKEVIRRGAFSKPLANKADVKLLVDHDNSKLVARTSAGNLRLTEDEIGLAIDASLPNTTVASDLRENIRVGNIDSMSFAFTVAEGGENWRREGDIYIRELTDCNLYDVSCVVDPAYNTTEVALRSFEKFMETQEPTEAEPEVISVETAEAMLKLLAL